MSEKVELVLESFGCFERQDFERLKRLWHPEIRVVAPGDWPEQGPFNGRDVALAQFERLAADNADQKIDIQDVKATGDWVVVTFRWHFKGKGSGIESAMDTAVACRVADAQITELHYTRTRNEALEAAGLSE
jgi:ketosteroid isomerase-like protein